MNLSCGTDIIEIARVKHSIETCQGFQERVFTKEEINYCEQKKVAKYQSFAGKFAGKEAVVKALGTGFAKGISLQDIEIQNNENGKPNVQLYGNAKRIFKQLCAKEISISISHSDTDAVAFVVILF